MNNLLTSLLLFVCLSSFTYEADTIRLENKPKAIISSWYPEFKDFPTLTIGEGKLLYITIPELDGTRIRDNHIELKALIDGVEIEETMKTNQYVLTVPPTDSNTIELELWFALENTTILLKENNEWKNVKELYPVRDGRILIDQIALELVK